MKIKVPVADGRNLAKKGSIWNVLKQAVGSILSRDKGGQKLSGSNCPRTQGQGCSS